MATVDVLIAGHVEDTPAGKSVHPTVSLVRDGDLWPVNAGFWAGGVA